MLNKFMSLFKANISKPAARWLQPEAEAQKWNMPDPSRYENQARLYAKSVALRTVIDAVVNSCIDADIDISDTDEKQDDNHPFIMLLDNPNGFDSRAEFLEATYKWYEITSNAYWWLNRTSAKNPPDELWVLPTSKIIPVPDGKLGLRGYMYYPGDGSQIPLEPYEVVHFKCANPFNRYVGLSKIETLAMILEGGIHADEWNTRLFAENNARLPGILAFSEMIQDADWERMKKEVGNAAAKRNNMMLRGVGKGGVEWMQGGVTQREMEFLEGIDANSKRVYDVYAPGFYNMITSNSSLANGETGLYGFQKFTISPILRLFEDKINNDIMPAYGDKKTVEFDDVVPEDKAQELAEIAAFAQFHTVDEVRVEKFGNKPDGDKKRGKLFVSQITATTGQPAPEPTANASNPNDETPQISTPQPEAVETTPAPALAPDNLKMDLSRWKRKAIKAGRVVEFTSDYIPADIHAMIESGLKSAVTADDIAAVFDGLKPVDSIRALADAINKAVEHGVV